MFNWATSVGFDKSSDESFWTWTVSQWNTVFWVTFTGVCAAALSQWSSDQVFVVLAFWNWFWACDDFTSWFFTSVPSATFVNNVSDFNFIGLASSSFVTTFTLGGTNVVDSVASVDCAWL